MTKMGSSYILHTEEEINLDLLQGFHLHIFGLHEVITFFVPYKGSNEIDQNF